MISIKKTYISLCFIFIINYTFAQTLSVKQYIDSFKNIAMREMIEYGRELDDYSRELDNNNKL